MNKKALVTLEYNKIIETLTSYAHSQMGKILCEKLTPDLAYDEIKDKQAETSQAVSLLYKKGSIPIGSYKDITPSLLRLKVNATLNMSELLSISYILDTCYKVKNYIKIDNIEGACPIIYQHITLLQPIKELNDAIKVAILSEDEMSDDASSTLRSIRREIKNTNDRVKQQLNHLINSSTIKQMLQDQVITMRNDRYCLPVKQEYRQQFAGMIHDQSSTGSTLFIEPMSIVKLNNELKELASREQDEIERILYDLSIQSSEYLDALQLNILTLAELDFIFAKAKLSKKLNCSEPIFNQLGYLNIKKARHPLLDQQKVVPIDIYLGKSYKLLIITGPNTGGKTVTLKTVGLLTLMGQSGLHIPAFDGSELAFFEEVYADIGDEQSIEQSLSTFSSHMTNIIQILENANYNSLVLFDELGAGTDPTEGAALAMSILQTLHKQNITTLATTHYSELKVFALSTEGIENACCEFDVTSLQPTYKLLIGVPGKSNAFAISKRLGLPNYIIENAQVLITKKDKQFEDLITDLEINKKSIEEEKQKTELYLEEIKSLKKSLEEKEAKSIIQKEKILQEAKEESYRILQQAKTFADESIRKYNNWMKSPKNTNQSTLESERQELRSKISDVEKSLVTKSQEHNSNRNNITNIKKGDTVFVSSLNQKGTVISAPSSKKEVLVQVGIIKTKVSLSYLEKVDEPIIKNPTLNKTGSGKVSINKSLSIRPEIDVRGKTSDEAISIIDKYMDDAYLSHLPQITIIHGKGTGALRASIHQHLKHLKYVNSFRLGKFGEGESGVTIVEFKG